MIVPSDTIMMFSHAVPVKRFSLEMWINLRLALLSNCFSVAFLDDSFRKKFGVWQVNADVPSHPTYIINVGNVDWNGVLKQEWEKSSISVTRRNKEEKDTQRNSKELHRKVYARPTLQMYLLHHPLHQSLRPIRQRLTTLIK